MIILNALKVTFYKPKKEIPQSANSHKKKKGLMTMQSSINPELWRNRRLRMILRRTMWIRKRKSTGQCLWSNSVKLSWTITCKQFQKIIRYTNLLSLEDSRILLKKFLIYCLKITSIKFFCQICKWKIRAFKYWNWYQTKLLLCSNSTIRRSMSRLSSFLCNYKCKFLRRYYRFKKIWNL